MNKTLILACCLLGLAGTGAAHAEGTRPDDGAEAQAFQAAKLSPAQALQAAEAKMGGKASGVSFEGPASAPYYQVELIATDGSTQDVAVDPASGEVMKLVGDGERDQGEGGDHEAADGQDSNGDDGEDPAQ